MKKILILCDTFYPDRTSGAKLLNDLTINLSKKNSLLVVVPRNSDFLRLFKNIKITNKKNIQIIFVPSYQIKNHNLIIRGISEFFMSYILWNKTKNILHEFNPTSMIVYSPSIFFKYFCKKIKNNFKIKSICILRDLFPYWAVDVGYIKNILIQKILNRIFINFLLQFDSIGLESVTNIKILKSKINLNYFYLPNWVNLKNFKSNKPKKKKKLDFIFAGNIGGGQDIEKVQLFMKSLPKEKINKFYLIGDGINSFKININEFKHLKDKIVIKKKLSQRNYINFLNKIDVGIVSLNDKIKSVNFPGRLFSYLMANKPVILLSKKNNELSSYLKNNKIGIKISNFKIINKDLVKINSIYNKILNDKHHIFNVLDKNHSLVKIIDQIENRL